MLTAFQKELALVIAFKMMAMLVIWLIWFSDAAPPQTASHLLSGNNIADIHSDMQAGNIAVGHVNQGAYDD